MKVLVLAEPKKAIGFKIIGIEAPDIGGREECEKILKSIEIEDYAFIIIQKEWSDLIKDKVKIEI